MTWDFALAPLVIPGALFASVNTADGKPVALVEERRCLIMLGLPVLNYEPIPRVIRIDWEKGSNAFAVGIATKPVEAMFAECGFSEDLIAKINHVSLLSDRMP